jgi:hypothetical protein
MRAFRQLATRTMGHGKTEGVQVGTIGRTATTCHSQGDLRAGPPASGLMVVANISHCALLVRDAKITVLVVFER